MIEAKVFQSGNSQAVRLPKGYRLSGDSVHLSRIGNLLVLIPKDDPWRSFVEGVAEASEFPIIDNTKEEIAVRKEIDATTVVNELLRSGRALAKVLG